MPLKQVLRTAGFLYCKHHVLNRLIRAANRMMEAASHQRMVVLPSIRASPNKVLPLFLAKTQARESRVPQMPKAIGVDFDSAITEYQAETGVSKQAQTHFACTTSRIRSLYMYGISDAHESIGRTNMAARTSECLASGCQQPPKLEEI